MTERAPGLGPYRLRLNFPYLLGIYLGINALPGSFLLVDGPDCAFLKAQHLWGRHDLASTLLDPAGQHRILFSGADGRAAGRFDERLDELQATAQTELVVVTSLPATTGDDPAASPAAGRTEDASDRPVLHIPGRSLRADWLDGYAAFLTSLAHALPLTAGPPRSDQIGIVGYLFDRNEADQQASVAELGRLLAGCDLELCATWLSGTSSAELGAIGRAGTVVSLPYGRRAARVLCERTGAKLVELGLPWGLRGTASWLRAVAASCGRRDLADRTIDAELGEAVPRLEPVVGRLLLGRRFVVGQDPFLAAALVELLEELGGEMALVVVPAGARHRTALRGRSPLDDRLALWEPREHELEAATAELDADLAIATSEVGRYVDLPTVELGFPSVHHHGLHEAPLTGFRGALLLVERIANELRRPWPAT